MKSINRIAIVGGGFTGTALAIQLLRCGDEHTSVFLLEASDRVGGEDAAGRALEQLLYEAWSDARGSGARMIILAGAAVTDVRRWRMGFGVKLQGRTELEVESVCLATGGARPREPLHDLERAATPRYIREPTSHRLQEVGPTDDVLMLGTGPALIDAVEALERVGHQGRIVAVSSQGVAPPSKTVQRLVEGGRLDIVAGRVCDATEHDSAVEVRLWVHGAPGSRTDAPSLRSEFFEWVIDGSEPVAAALSPLESRLLESGLLKSDARGYAATQNGVAIGKHGPVSGLYLLGPPCCANDWRQGSVADLPERAEAFAVRLLEYGRRDYDVRRRA